MLNQIRNLLAICRRNFPRKSSGYSCKNSSRNVYSDSPKISFRTPGSLPITSSWVSFGNEFEKFLRKSAWNSYKKYSEILPKMIWEFLENMLKNFSRVLNKNLFEKSTDKYTGFPQKILRRIPLGIPLVVPLVIATVFLRRISS